MDCVDCVGGGGVGGVGLWGGQACEEEQEGAGGGGKWDEGEDIGELVECECGEREWE